MVTIYWKLNMTNTKNIQQLVNTWWNDWGENFANLTNHHILPINAVF